MKPESLKQLAEYMGYGDAVIFINDYGTFVLVEYKGNKIVEYNPLKDAEQCLELMEKFEWLSFERPMGHDFIICEYRVSLMDDYAGTVKGNSINEAVTAAAIAAIKE